MTKLNGIIIPGELSASGQKTNWEGHVSIYYQKKFLKKNYYNFYQELEKCEMATINIEFKNKFIPISWEYVFDKVYWLPHSNTWYEKLSFNPITLIHRNSITKAWLYMASKSPHKNNNYLIEVIAPKIQDLQYNDTCTVEIDEKYYS